MTLHRLFAGLAMLLMMTAVASPSSKPYHPKAQKVTKHKANKPARHKVAKHN